MRLSTFRLALALCCLTGSALAGPNAESRRAEGPNFDGRVTQDQISLGELGLREIRMAGLRVFTTAFNKLAGYGDGPMDLADTVSAGGRPSLQGNGTLLRVNGLDGQTCLECHSVLSAATVPPRLGIGGVGGAVTNAIIMPTTIDPADLLDFDEERRTAEEDEAPVGRAVEPIHALGKPLEALEGEREGVGSAGNDVVAQRRHGERAYLKRGTFPRETSSNGWSTNDGTTTRSE